MDEQSFALQIQAQHFNAPTAEADKTLLDKRILGALGANVCSQRLLLPAAADDQALALGATAAFILWSRNDAAFSVRYADGETLIGPSICHIVCAKRTSAQVFSGSLLLTGNGAEVADIEVWNISTYDAG